MSYEHDQAAPAEVQEMKEAILNLISGRLDSSFVDLYRSVPGFAGNCMLGTNYENLFLWDRLSVTAVKAMAELHREDKLQYKESSTFTYIIDGIQATLPTAKRVRAYTKPHWLPVTIHPTSKKAVGRSPRRSAVKMELTT